MPRDRLGLVDKQRLFLLHVEGTGVPCPVCQGAINVFDAAGDIDQYDFGKTEYCFRCPHCQAVLEQVVQLDRARTGEQSRGKEER